MCGVQETNLQHNVFTIKYHLFLSIYRQFLFSLLYLVDIFVNNQSQLQMNSSQIVSFIKNSLVYFELVSLQLNYKLIHVIYLIINTSLFPHRVLKIRSQLMESKLAYYEVFDLFGINAVSIFQTQSSIFRILLLNYES